MSEARIHTRSFEFPRKLYQIGPMGLKDGLEVDFLKIGGLFLVAWFAALTLLFGLPTQVTFPLYVTIPVVIVYWGFTPDPKHARRRRLVAWMLAARYALVGHIPIVAGKRAGERSAFSLPVNASTWPPGGVPEFSTRTTNTSGNRRQRARAAPSRQASRSHHR